MPLAALATGPFAIRFSGGAGVVSPSDTLQVGVPVLAGLDLEALFPEARPAGTRGGYSLYRSGSWLLGHATAPVGGDVGEAARNLYRDLFGATRGWHPCRIWNYVPQINAGVGGLENYRAFCRGRGLAFEAEFGAGQYAAMCAASAVGTREDRLVVVFAASGSGPRHYENPAQVPAYRYPAEHGPLAPSFARATASPDGGVVFVAGTSAIKGHATVAPGDTAAQVDCTLDNLALISRATGLGDDLGAGAGWTRHFKVYLRRASDFPAVRARLESGLIRAGDPAIWLQADICRADLNLEIEATLLAPAPNRTFS